MELRHEYDLGDKSPLMANRPHNGELSLFAVSGLCCRIDDPLKERNVREGQLATALIVVNVRKLPA
jgi:hypothetical protein